MGSTPSAEEWSGTDVSISEIESELARLRAESADEDGQPQQRTSVMTHVAWVPPEWLDAAERVLDGCRSRRPSSTRSAASSHSGGTHAMCVITLVRCCG